MTGSGLSRVKIPFAVYPKRWGEAGISRVVPRPVKVSKGPCDREAIQRCLAAPGDDVPGPHGWYHDRPGEKGMLVAFPLKLAVFQQSAINAHAAIRR